MRQRNRSFQIGPEFKFNSTLQVQRLIDTLSRETGRYFKIEDFNGSSSFRNDVALREYVKTGKNDFVPDVNPDHFESVTDLHAA